MHELYCECISQKVNFAYSAVFQILILIVLIIGGLLKTISTVSNRITRASSSPYILYQFELIAGLSGYNVKLGQKKLGHVIGSLGPTMGHWVMSLHVCNGSWVTGHE